MSAWVDKPDEIYGSGNFSGPRPAGDDPLRLAAYTIVAVAAFLTGLLLGSLSVTAPSGSRIEWPSSAPSKPHPRSLQP
jgi:hypothetical protein